MVIKPKKVMGIIIIGLILFPLCGGMMYAQNETTTGQELWTYTHTWTGLNDFAQDIFYDSATGRVYVAGQVGGAGGVDRTRYVVACLDANTGAVIWKYEEGGGATYPENRANAVVVGSDGFIYSVGQIKSSTQGWCMRIIKHNSINGNAVANLILNYIGGAYDDALLDVEYGPDNRIYACGYSGWATIDLFTVVRLDNSLNPGSAVFYRMMNGVNYSRAEVLKIDENSNIWAGGYSEGADDDFTVVKLDTALTVQGTYTFNGSAGGSDRCLDLALPWPGGTGIYAAGYSNHTGEGDNLTVVHLNDEATEDWVYEYDGPVHGDDRAYQVVAGPSNYIYTAGYSTDSVGQEDYTVVCLQFGQQWVYTYNGSADGEDQALTIGIDNTGDYVYAAGYSNETNQNKNIIVTKHNSAGSVFWNYTYHNANGDDGADDIYVATDGRLYIDGYMKPYGAGGSFAAMALPQNFPPTAPTLISPEDSTFLPDTNVTLTWNGSMDFETSVNQYMITCCQTHGFLSGVDTFYTSDTIYTADFIDAKWYWRVKAQDTDGNWGAWSEIYVFDFDLTAPSAPTLIDPIDDVILVDLDVDFGWETVMFNGVASLVHYVLQIDTTDQFPSPIYEDTFDIAYTTVTHSGEDRYYWRVKAYDLAGNESNWSDPIGSFRIDLTNPLIDSVTVLENTPPGMGGPFDVYAKVTDLWGINSVRLHYKRMEDPVWFSVDMIVGQDDWYTEQIPSATLDNDTIKYKYYARDNAGYTSWNPETDYYWFIANVLGIQENNENPKVFSINVQSNPLRSNQAVVFNVALPEGGRTRLAIYNALGRLVYVKEENRSAGYHTILWTEKTAGVYFYTFESETKKKVGKVVLVR